LLIVIGVMAILASMLLPVLKRAKAKAQTIKCMSNVQQFALASAMYISDEGMFDLSGWTRPLLVRYGMVEAIRYCPNAPLASNMFRYRTNGFGTVNSAWYHDLVGASYAQNGYLSQYVDASQPRLNYRQESEIQEPSITPFFADAVDGVINPLETDLPAGNLFSGGTTQPGVWGPASQLGEVTIPRHNASLSAAVADFDPKNLLPGAVNVGFADAHAETVRLEKLWGLAWHKGWKTPPVRPGRSQ
jgi:prepilin-type processing-associated H-X9-DG protein